MSYVFLMRCLSKHITHTKVWSKSKRNLQKRIYLHTGQWSRTDWIWPFECFFDISDRN